MQVASNAMTAIPPTTPPTIGPVLLDLFDVFDEPIELVGTTMIVVVTTLPDESVVIIALENVEETVLGTVESEVVEEVVDNVLVLDAAVEDVEATLVSELVDATDSVDTDDKEADVEVVVAVSVGEAAVAVPVPCRFHWGTASSAARR